MIREAGVKVLDRQAGKFVPLSLDPPHAKFPMKVPPTGCVLMP
jgi:hypothetical protein